MDRLLNLQVTEKWHVRLAMHKNPDPENIPCYRVVNFKGELSGEFAFGGAGKQAELLEADGVEVINGKVDLKKYGMNIYL